MNTEISYLSKTDLIKTKQNWCQPSSFLISKFLTSITLQVQQMEQELLTFQENLSEKRRVHPQF